MSGNKRKSGTASLYSGKKRAVFRNKSGGSKFIMAAKRASARRQYPEGKTFDVVAVTSTLNIQLDATTAVADSANGYVAQGAAAAASAVVLNQVPLGTTSTTRIGRRINMKRIRITGAVLSPTGAAKGEVIKIALVYIPTQDRGVTVMPPYNVIWGSQNPVAQRVIDNSDRYKVLKNWTLNVSGDRDAVTTGLEAQYCDDMIDLKGLLCEWTQADTTGSFNDMEKGALCLYGCSTAVTGVVRGSSLVK